MLEVVPKGASGLGVDVKKGVSIPKGTVLGAYFGCLGTRLGNDDYTVEMPPVRHVGRTYRIDVSAAREARRGTERPAARPCRCAGPDDCPAGRFFLAMGDRAKN
jgi:hypothetical protein